MTRTVGPNPDTGRPLPLKRSAAAMLFTDRDGRVLVVNPTYKPQWELPGGIVEENESPRTAAEREIAEELGIERTVGLLLAVDYVPAHVTRSRSEGLILVFDGGVLDDTNMIRLPADELSAWEFVEPDRLADYLPALQTRRALAALAARAAGSAVYLESGSNAGGEGPAA